MFDIIDEMPEEPDEALIFLITFIEEGYDGYFNRSGTRGMLASSKPNALSALHMLKQVQSRSSFPDIISDIAQETMELIETNSVNHDKFLSYFAGIKSNAMASQIDQKLDQRSISTFNLPRDDIDKIFDLTGEMRTYVSTESNFSDLHKNRIL